MSNYFNRGSNGLRAVFSTFRDRYNFRVEKLNKEKDDQIVKSENRIDRAEQDYEELVIEKEAEKEKLIASAQAMYSGFELKRVLASINKSINLDLLNDPERGRQKRNRVINRAKKGMVRIEREFPQKALNRTRKIRQTMYDISNAAATPNNNCARWGDGPRCSQDVVPISKFIRPDPVSIPITFPVEDLFS
jgi:hypothetical protein